MPDPVLLAIATTVAAKGAESMVEGGRSAVAALVRLLRRRLGSASGDAGEPGGSPGAALTAALAEPEDTVRRERLAAVLADLVREDPAFGDALRAHWSAASAELGAAASGGVVNQFSGRAGGPVVQARDVRGDISF